MRFLPILFILIGVGCAEVTKTEPPQQQEQAEPGQPEPELGFGEAKPAGHGHGHSPIVLSQPEYHKDLLDIAEIRALPNYHWADVLVKGLKPDFQIVQIQNSHFVDRKRFEADGGRDWEAFLKSVEAVQEQQIEVLKRLRDDYGVKAVFLEGLTEADLDEYHNLAKALAKWQEPAQDDPMSEFLRQQYREDSLLLGAAARVEGLEILPAEEAVTLQAADPQKPGYDLEAIEKRENAIVKRLRSSGHRVAVVILGGEHGLSDNMMRELDDNVAYASIQVEAHHDAETRKPGY